MRKLGRRLGVDPMAIYYHVSNKAALLALVTDRVIGTMGPPDPKARWDERVRQWALGYWDVVATFADLILAGIADPAVGDGGRRSTEELLESIAASGLSSHLVESSAFVIVDAVHGSALAAARTGDRSEARATARRLFEAGLDTILWGIAARATAPTER